MDRSFTARHRLDAAFWLAFTILAWFLVYMGFAPQIDLRFSGKADYPAPPALIIHVWSVSAWLSLLGVQVALRHFNLMRCHRALGLVSVLLIPTIFISAISAEIVSERFYAPQYPEVVRFFPIPLTSMITFAACGSTAIAFRREPAMHKRLIYLATSALLVATFFRWWGETLTSAVTPGILGEWVINYLGVSLLFAIGIGHDLLTRGRVHRAFLIAVPLMLAAQWLAVVIGQSDWWPPIGRQILGI
jgi:hypothetical protein